MNSRLDDYDYHFDELSSKELSKDKYPILNNMHFVSRILYYASGTDLQIIQNCPHADKIKMQCIGGTVLATAILAFLSGSFAFYTVFGPKALLTINATPPPMDLLAVFLACFFGFIWSCIIFNLDRFIVSSTGHGDGTDKITLSELARAIPRILMAMAIGFVLSKPLELKIMESELTSILIDVQKEKADGRLGKEIPGFESQINELKIQQQSKKDQMNKLQSDKDSAQTVVYESEKQLREELEGISGSGKKGPGPATDVKKAQLVSHKDDLRDKNDKLEKIQPNLEKDIANLQSEIDRVNKQKLEREHQINVDAGSENGMMARLREAHKYYFWPGMCLTILMIMLEIAPLIFKMMITFSPYDFVQENIKRKSIARQGIILNESPDEEHEIKLSNSTYFAAKIIEEEQDHKKKITSHLLDKALEHYLKSMEEQMRKNPERFLEMLKLSTNQVDIPETSLGGIADQTPKQNPDVNRQSIDKN